MELDMEKLLIEEKKLLDDPCRIHFTIGLPFCLPDEFWGLYLEEY
jgi:hypothetical protein